MVADARLRSFFGSFSVQWIPFVCIILLFIGLVVDLNTDSALVVAIIFNIPIAISGAYPTTRVTVWTTVLALIANVAAGYDNAIEFGGNDEFIVLNRTLAALSFLIVGLMTLLFERSHEEVEELATAEIDGEMERRLRQLIVDLIDVPDEDFQHSITVGLRQLLDAEAVAITGVDGERFSEPRWVSPPRTNLAESGKLATWAVDALPLTARPVITVRNEQGIMSVARWRRHQDLDDLVVIASRPNRHRASELLGEALEGIEAIDNRRHERGAAATDRPPSEPEYQGAATASTGDPDAAV